MERSRTMEYGLSSSPSFVDTTFPNTAAPERALVARGKAGDQAAFMELIRRSSPTALRSIRAIANNPADVEDVMQDAVISAFKGLRSFNQQSKFSTWLTRIAINCALMLIRRRNNSIEISLEESTGRPFQFADHRINPEQALIRDQSINIIRRAVHTLPSTLREYVEQRCFEELPHREAASSLGISLAAGKARSFRARQRLQCLLASRRCQPGMKCA